VAGRVLIQMWTRTMWFPIGRPGEGLGYSVRSTTAALAAFVFTDSMPFSGERRNKTGSGLLASSCTASRHHRTVCTELSSASPLAGVTGRPKRGWGGPINDSGYADLVPIDCIFLSPQPRS
jgi:hypothetical protein